MITNERKKEIEKLLLEYKNIDLKIESLEIHIEALSNNINIPGVYCFGEDQRADLIERLKKEKNSLIALDKTIKIALKSLDIEEYKILELRYLQERKMTWFEIGSLINMDHDNCCKFNTKILNKLDQFMTNLSPVFRQFIVAFQG